MGGGVAARGPGAAEPVPAAPGLAGARELGAAAPGAAGPRQLERASGFRFWVSGPRSSRGMSGGPVGAGYRRALGSGFNWGMLLGRRVRFGRGS